MVQRDYRAYAVVYLIAGSGFYGDVHIGRVVLAAGDMLVLFPGLAHDYGPLVPGAWDEGWVGFAGPVFAALEADGVLDRRQPLLHYCDRFFFARQFRSLVGQPPGVWRAAFVGRPALDSGTATHA